MRAGSNVTNSQFEAGGFALESVGFDEEKADEPPNNGFVVVDDFVASVPAAGMGVVPNSPPDIVFGADDVLGAPNVEAPAVAPVGFCAPNRPLPEAPEGLPKPPPRSPLPAVLVVDVVLPPPKSPPPGAVEEPGVAPKRPLPGVVEDVLLALPNKLPPVFAGPKMFPAGLAEVPDANMLLPFQRCQVLTGKME